MSKRMLIDATHGEETRVVVLDGNRLEDFDIETAAKRQLKGNIYLAKVVRVEPSLQAAFVEYGGNRHGFLAFSEIHPDYYQIPVADRQRLLELQAEQARLEDEEEDLELALSQAGVTSEPNGAPDGAPDGLDTPAPLPTETETWARSDQPPLLEPRPASRAMAAAIEAGETLAGETVAGAMEADESLAGTLPAGLPADGPPDGVAETATAAAAPPPAEPAHFEPSHSGPAHFEPAYAEPWAIAVTPPLIEADSAMAEAVSDASDQPDGGDDLDMFGSIPEEAPPETVGGDTDADGDGDSENGEDRPARRIPPRFLRNYHIQEVIHRRQILLVQVVKEERGTKGAALTTYLSLAGRFSVLMPNSPRGGGISRKITSAADRRRLKEIMAELDIPSGMGMIVRTAGAQRPKPEIKRDCEYLLRLWDDIREHTLKSIAPALIYEEASLIKRAIRDVYSRDVDEIVVDGEAGWNQAHEFMRMLMPSHARKVQLWPDTGPSLFARYQVEAQLDAMMQPTVQLRSGGYLVINQAEALVAIDVNSGRSTRERNVEETALRTNLEAAEEVARTLRLRDLAGLIVIDLIDMESKRHNAMVERRLKEALKDDRARIQVGHISHFGLLEMSRQRLRPSLEETTLIVCPHCNGTGHVRGTESAALYVLRGVEEEAGKRRSAEIVVHVAMSIALYILNHKRERLNEIERRYGMRVVIAADDSLISPRFRIDRVRALVPGEEPRFVTPDAPRVSHAAAPLAGVDAAADVDEDEDETAEAEADAADEAIAGEDTEEGREAAERRRRRRRRRRRGGREDEVAPREAVSRVAEETRAEPTAPERAEPEAEPVSGAVSGPASGTAPDEDANRRRSRRGGRRRGRGDGEYSPHAVPGAEQPDLIPAYAGPTPADPFGGQAFDIFDVMEQAELNAAQAQRPRNDRGPRHGRSRWHPPHWAVASEPPMLVNEAADRSDRGPDRGADRGPAVEQWALPSRPFMMRRDRHAPRWSRERGGPGRGAPAQVPAQVPVAEAVEAVAKLVPIESGPPPAPEFVSGVTPQAPELVPAEARFASASEPVHTESAPPREPVREPAAAESVHAESAPAPKPVREPVAAAAAEQVLSAEPPVLSEVVVEARKSPQAELALPVAGETPPAAPDAQARESAPPMPEAAQEAQPVPANDIVAGPVVRPIVIGTESTPPPERKRGWWRRG
jgi:ribonuclease E